MPMSKKKPTLFRFIVSFTIVTDLVIFTPLLRRKKTNFPIKRNGPMKVSLFMLTPINITARFPFIVSTPTKNRATSTPRPLGKRITLPPGVITMKALPSMCYPWIIVKI